MDSEEDEEEGGSVETRRRRRSRKIPEKACGLARLDVVKVSEDEDKLQPRGKKKPQREQNRGRWSSNKNWIYGRKNKQTNKTTKKEKKK